MRVTILTNGPGELWGWVRPVAMELRRRGHSVSLWLLPCQFASGHEREAASLLGVDKLEGPMSAARLWRALGEERTDCAVQLGGDLAFGLRLSKAARVPLTCYTYGPKKGLKGGEGLRLSVLTAFPSQALQIPNARPIGDLVQDSLLMDAQTPQFSQAAWDWPEGQVSPGDANLTSPRVLFLPGSRPAIRRAALPWLAVVEESLRALCPSVRVRTLFPPFVPEAELRPWRDAGLNPVRTGAGIAMRGADFALTQPGTNTLELMHCGLPSLVAAPSSFLGLVPIPGLRGMLASLPLVGNAIRRGAVRHILGRWGGFISLPNRISGRRILDEAWGDISPQQVAERVAASLRAPEALAQTRAELLAMSGRPGAAGRLCDAISALPEENAPLTVGAEAE
ncbi:MAG: hypothetical protein IJ702_01770 [Fretibacterium sp.]|nr:hypothetical protein [Fretibacterium sp.]